MSDNSISASDVKHIAKLANLNLTDAEISMFPKQLTQVVAHFQSLSKLNLTETPITAQVTGLENITRVDQVGNRTLTQAQVTQSAPKHHKGYIVVPAILNKDA